MNGLLSLIRRNNIFGSMNNDTNPISEPYRNINFDQPMQQPNIPQLEVDEYDPAARMRELYQPQTDMINRYGSALDDMPVRENPHWARKLLAGVSAFAGDPKLVDHALYAPHYRDMQDWQTRIKPLAEGANLERQNNTNMRGIANSIISQEQSGRRLERQYARDNTLRLQGEERLRQGNERLSDADRRIVQADERLKIAREVTKGGQLDIDDFGNARIVRKDGTTIPVNGDYLSFEEKEALRAESAGARARAVTENKPARVVERIIEDPNNLGKTIRVSINLDTGEATPITVRDPNKPAPQAAPPRTELEQGREVVNRAQSVKNSNPKWSKWVKIEPGGRVSIQKPGIFSGPSEQEYQQIYDSIYGTQALQTPNIGGRGRGNNPNQPTSTGQIIKQYSPSRDQTRISTDGGKTWKIVQGRQ